MTEEKKKKITAKGCLLGTLLVVLCMGVCAYIVSQDPGQSPEQSIRYDMRIGCVELVEEILKAHPKRDFPHISTSGPAWTKHAEREILYLDSYVDAENVFGATVRIPWKCGLNTEAKEYVFLQVGGEIILDTK